MFGFPDETEFRFLLGQDLLSVLVSQHCSVLSFSNEARITIEGSGRINKSDNALDARETGKASICWIGLPITSIVRTDIKHLSIVWGNGDELHFFDDQENHETFWFLDQATQKSIVV